MSDQTKPIIPITVEFSEALSALASAKGAQAFERRLSSALRGLLERLGLSGEPSVTVRSYDSGPAVRVFVNETLQPHEPSLMKGIWLAVAPAEARDAAENHEAILKYGSPDGWFIAYVSDLSDKKSDLTLAFEYLTRLVTEIITQRPEFLVGPEQAAVYLQTSAARTQQAEPALSPEEMLSLLKSLVSLGVDVADHSLVWKTINVSRQAGRSVEDTTESIFTHLRSARVEIHAHPAYLSKCLKISPPAGEENGSPGRLGTVLKFFTNVVSTLAEQRSSEKSLPVYSAQVPENVREMFRMAEDQIFNDFGLQLPELVLVASTKMREGLISIKINDRLTPPALGLQPGELLVTATVEQLAELDVPGRPAGHVLADTDYAVADESHGDTVRQRGFAAYDITSVVLLILYREVRRQAARLLGVEDTEYQLARLRQDFPTLVRVSAAHFSAGDLTRVIRGLLSAGLSVRDARAILERLLQFDTVSVASADHVAFDARLELQTAVAPEGAGSWENYCAFVKKHSGALHHS